MLLYEDTGMRRFGGIQIEQVILAMFERGIAPTLGQIAIRTMRSRQIGFLVQSHAPVKGAVSVARGSPARLIHGTKVIQVPIAGSVTPRRPFSARPANRRAKVGATSQVTVKSYQRWPHRNDQNRRRSPPAATRTRLTHG